MAHCIVTTTKEYINLKEAFPTLDERFLKAAVAL